MILNGGKPKYPDKNLLHCRKCEVCVGAPLSFHCIRPSLHSDCKNGQRSLENRNRTNKTVGLIKFYD